jgi:hypothetical protein
MKSMPNLMCDVIDRGGRENIKVFLTFADARMYRSARRIARQAASFSVYDKVICADEGDLDESFVAALHNHLIPGSRGYGYWSWKPQIILQTLAQMEEGDILQYTDAGCHLNLCGRSRLLEYFSAADKSESGILAFQAKPPEAPFEYDGRPLPDLSEFKWTKGDLLEHFSAYENEDVYKTQQIGGTLFFIRKCAAAEKIVSAWRDVYLNNFSLADDSASIKANLPGFLEHRHDQSIFSVLCKLHNVQTISAYEYWYPKKGSMRADWGALRNYPVLARRDLDFGPAENFRRFFKRIQSQARHVAKKIGVLK